MSKIKFGTDGWRAVIDEDFNHENVGIAAQAVADYVKEEVGDNRPIVVGYDTRKNSRGYGEDVAGVLAGNGISTILVDRPTPTPAVTYAIKQRKLGGGVMITASHNPPKYNGMKYKADYAGSADPGITKKIEENLYKNRVSRKSVEAAKKEELLSLENIIPAQLSFISNYLDMGILKKADFRVLVDAMYGTGNNFLEELLGDTSCKVSTIHNEHDTNFGGIAPEPNAKNLAELMKRTEDGKYDLGLATDGDADRAACVSPDGRLLTGHKLMALLLLHFIEDKKLSGSVVQTICGTVMIEKICRKYKLKLHETSVGFKYICDIMRREDVLIGGEETGGIGFKNYMPERDGILTCLLVLEMLAFKKKGILEILADAEEEYGKFYYQRKDVEYPEEKKKTMIQGLLKNPPKGILGKRVVDTKTYDGVKFLCEDASWLLLRLSGTEPIVRVYAEAESDKKALEIIDFGKSLIT